MLFGDIFDDTLELTDYEFCLLDLNSDGIVNILDVVGLVNLILEF